MIRIFLLIIFIFSIFMSSVKAEQKIVFVDIDRVISSSKSGISILKQLKELNQKKLSVLNKREKDIKEKETKLISQKNIISETEFKSRVDLLKKEINEHNQNRNKMITDFNRIKIENTNKLLKLINPILIKFSDDNKISFILQKKNLVMGKTELDITEEIIKIVNNNVKGFKVK